MALFEGGGMTFRSAQTLEGGTVWGQPDLHKSWNRLARLVLTRFAKHLIGVPSLEATRFAQPFDWRSLEATSLT